MRKSLPKIGQRCSTPTGEGKVIGINILRRQVTLVVDGQRIEVGDRDLGTVVRWDTASKSGEPPPSISRVDAIAQGLIEATEEDRASPPRAPNRDWLDEGPTTLTPAPGGDGSPAAARAGTSPLARHARSQVHQVARKVVVRMIVRLAAARAIPSEAISNSSAKNALAPNGVPRDSHPPPRTSARAASSGEAVALARSSSRAPRASNHLPTKIHPKLRIHRPTGSPAVLVAAETAAVVVAPARATNLRNDRPSIQSATGGGSDSPRSLHETAPCDLLGPPQQLQQAFRFDASALRLRHGSANLSVMRALDVIRRSPPAGILVAAVAAAALLSAACGNAGADSRGIQVTLVTRVVSNPTETPIPGVSPTPIVPPGLVLSAVEVYQAGAVLVSVTGDITGGAATFLGRNFKLAQGKQSMFAFVAIDTEDPTGPQPLRVDVTLANSSKANLQDTITVLPTEWTTEALDFTEEQTETLLDPTVVSEEAAMLKTLYSGVTPEKLWEGPWEMPVNGAITARYGEQRSINGSVPSGHHGGTDIGAELGTPVLATNSGRVVLARQLKVHGNMIVIDHGGGLFSGYAHLSAFNVTEGQLVEQGQQVGEVGSTGLSTGAHLHWEMASQGILLDALRFTDGTNGF